MSFEEPSCPHQHECPGCPRLGEPYASQLEHKRQRLAHALSGFTPLSALAIDATVSVPPQVHYRERAKLVAGPGGLGLYRRGSHELVDLPGCIILDPAVERVVALLREKLTQGPLLEGVDVVRTDRGCLVTLIAGERTADAQLTAFAEALRHQEPLIEGIAVSQRPSGAVQLLGADLRVVSGTQHAPRRLLAEGPYHLVTYGGFAQAHRATAALLARTLLDGLLGGLGPRPRIVELYAGAGALALTLAQRGCEVLAVEAFAPAAQRISMAAAAQHLQIEVRATDAAAEMEHLAECGTEVDAVVVNPPRRGLEARVRFGLGRVVKRRIAYVSCEPRTLARDLAHLSLLGFRATRLAPFDMIPQTDQVETLALLERGACPLPHVIYEDDALLAVSKEPHEPTTPQGEHEGSLLSRVRRLQGAAEAVPVHRLDLGTSGVCLFARQASQVEAIARALAAGQKTYLALVRGITHGKGTIDRPLNEGSRKLAALSRYKRRQVIGGHSFLEVHPEQGRKHQVRRHLASIGHPVLGDARHGDSRSNLHLTMKHGLDRTFLHCAAIRLQWRGQPLELALDLAPDLRLVLDSLAAR